MKEAIREAIEAIREAMIALAAMTDDGLERLKTPWSAGQYNYATDGKMAVRATRMDEFGDRVENDGAANTIYGLTAAAGPTWYDVPELPAAPATMTCPRCKGQKRRECDACESTGTATFELWHKAIRYTAEDTCPVCDGECGDCSKCYAKGTITPEEAPVEIGPAIINPAYLRILATLPGCQIAPVDGCTVAVFRFTGGSGAVMPIRR